MKILFLGPVEKSQKKLESFLLDDDNDVTMNEEKLNTEDIFKHEYNFLISFGYRHIIRKNILNYFKEKSINLHISYLPWNKGADPNLWSVLENTPKGITIHQMDQGLDSGPILCQKRIYFDEDDTLKSSHEKLQTGMVELFKSNWEDIKYKKIKPRNQKGKGSYHKLSDKNNYLELLTNGWDSKIKDLEGKAIHA